MTSSAHYTEIPISLVWDAFGEKNGAVSLIEMRARIGALRRETPRPWEDYVIGCILLAEPFYWPEELWIPEPPDWKPQIVRGKRYDLSTPPGKELWDRVVQNLEADPAVVRDRAPDTFTGSDVFGGVRTGGAGRRRIGQCTFSSLVRDLYNHTCAVSGERALPALEAVHIQPFEITHEHEISNGILLRSDVHRLFDAGYITVTPELRVEASGRMREDFNDGESYLKLHGRKVEVPEAPEFRPSPEYLTWHNENRYRD